MSTLSTGALDMLWEGMEVIKQARASTKSHSREPRTPLDRAGLVKNLRGYLAWAWTGRHDYPDSKEALAQAVAAEKPAWAQRLEKLFETVMAFDAMSEEDFRWRRMHEEAPMDGQDVIYFFDVVGTHPGHFEAPDPADEFSMDTFVGDFGGFLGGDVTHWMPRPQLAKTTSEHSLAA